MCKIIINAKQLNVIENSAIKEEIKGKVINDGWYKRFAKSDNFK